MVVFRYFSEMYREQLAAAIFKTTIMKSITTTLLLTFLSNTISFSQNTVENIIIVTTDGFRWQEVFKGVDSAIAEMSQFNQNKKKEIYNHYAALTKEESRKKIMPFLWSTIAQIAVKNSESPSSVSR